MGMYTELILGCELKKDTPENVINTIKFMTGQLDEQPKDYQFEDYERMRHLLIGGSYYFAINSQQPIFVYDSISNQYQLSSRSNIKNYNDEIETFLKYIKPYIEQGSGCKNMYAITIYEEEDEPTIYYLD